MTNADSYPSVNLGYGSCPSSSPTRFPKTATFPVSLVREMIMSPNPLKLCEELLTGSDLPHGSRVCDLGSGTGITSALLAREYGLDVYAVDLWSDPAENRAFFDSLGIPVSSIHPVKADASRGLPFCAGFFDAVVSIDSYNYYGRDSRYLDERLLPYVRTGGELHLSVPGMVHDCHDDLPSCLLASWTPEQLEYMHDMAWWKRMLGQSRGARAGLPQHHRDHAAEVVAGLRQRGLLAGRLAPASRVDARRPARSHFFDPDAVDASNTHAWPS